MATVNIGNLTFTHKGDYDGSTAYSKNDVVYYSTNGNAYIAKQATTGNAPTNATYWSQFAQGSGGIWSGGLSLGTANQVVAVNSGATALEFQDAASGGIAQVVQGTKTDTTSITGNSNQVFQDSGVSASITPSSTSNKILIMANLIVGSQGGQRTAGKLVSVIGGSTADIFRADAAGSRARGHTIMNLSNGYNSQTFQMHYLYSPNTTSAVTIKAQLWVEGSSTMYVNRNDTDTDSSTWSRGASQITLMEVTV